MKDGLNDTIRMSNELYEVRVSESVDWFLGVKLEWDDNSIATPRAVQFSQSLYIESMLRRFGMEDSKAVPTPMIESFWSAINEEMDKTTTGEHFYQQMIGSPLYLALRTPFDILPAVSIVSRSQKSPTSCCLQAAKRILRYVKGNWIILWNIPRMEWISLGILILITVETL